MSNDILTQLQTCYDQLLTQFFATLSYLSQRHPLVAPDPDPNDPFTNPPAGMATARASSRFQALNPPNDTTSAMTAIPTVNPGPEDTDRAPFPLHPVPPATFANAQRELAEDLVLKGQQIEMLISRLPGIGKGTQEQAEDIKVLADKVQKMEQERHARRREMKEYADRLERVIMAMAVNVDYGDDDTGNGNGLNGHG
ncbi:uncharacterized protein Z520_06931 [Fonsecaea multimorphosa CBS 102226]|uniref:Mediator of RNA polymerase II transcription subunit 21 n=1 Tax=Fonsecaea multimorphosa CBS 102226 TaxID=1442371 RepID=A0A0D2K311_9EURO|nr:uncharacterized protein Z520_06931 [Fonsecaea multimorphosa CBS 102226]KIX97479.1 hypothetical protein Z520_06931 [Fonsecaea multimorphosa CBS 102226]OAL23441.1 hypothetical protein AYO22_06491 [Fonsecaea multimorphosa]